MTYAQIYTLTCLDFFHSAIFSVRIQKWVGTHIQKFNALTTHPLGPAFKSGVFNRCVVGLQPPALSSNLYNKWQISAVFIILSLCFYDFLIQYLHKTCAYMRKLFSVVTIW